jgi:formylglycine-generating enzyme required for sulfatase activity
MKDMGFKRISTRFQRTISRSARAQVIFPMAICWIFLAGWAARGGDFQMPTNWAWIKPGSFTMGSPANEVDRDADEGPQFQVNLTKGFWMAKTEVTQKEYQDLMGSNPSGFTRDLRRPVERVNWQEAMDYCVKLTLREQQAGHLPPGQVYRLPTEAEWEYACRAGTTTRFSFGNDPKGGLLSRYAWHQRNGKNTTHPAGQKRPNAWGLHDMHGNVWEWCLDWYSSYPEGQVSDPKGPPQGIKRVARGGCWNNPDGTCRSANRIFYEPTRRSNGVGFRVVLAPNL